MRELVVDIKEANAIHFNLSLSIVYLMVSRLGVMHLFNHYVCSGL